MTIKFIVETLSNPDKLEGLGAEIDFSYELIHINDIEEHDNWFFVVRIRNYLDILDAINKGLESFVPQRVIDNLNNGYVLFQFSEPNKEYELEALKNLTTLNSFYKRFLFITLHKVDHPNFILFSRGEMRDNDLLNSKFSLHTSDLGRVIGSDISTFEDKNFFCLLHTYYENPYRLLILSLLEKLNLLDEGFVSAYNCAKDFAYFKGKQPWVEEFTDTLTFTSCDSIFNDIDIEQAFQKTKLNLVVEGDINYNSTYITTKIARNFWREKPFIVLGQPGTLKMLKELGYKTFEPFIDESYDLEPRFEIRLLKALKALKNTFDTSLNTDEIKKILKHNHSVWINRKSTSYRELYDYT